MSVTARPLSDWWEPHPEHLGKIKESVEAWNQWRKDDPLVVPVLHFADLREADLRGADFSNAHLSHAKLSGADLRGANFYAAELFESDHSGADLGGADLRGARLHLVNMCRASLREANLYRVDFIETRLEKADFSLSICGSTAFTRVDLSNTVGLEEVIHHGPSAVDAETLRLSGTLPIAFLRGCGLPETFIEYIPSILNVPLEFYSCFISYSSRDQEFADRLYADLQNKGVRCWFAPHDMKIGARIRPAIDESIRVYDKLLLVLSEYSVSSQWVEQEVETALGKERQAGGVVLFPVRLDDTVFKAGEGWPAFVKNTRHVGDFTRWKEHDSYREAFDRLLRDLRAGA
jgi:uncharacterized protein YjbI with pentapeptide repeats